MRYDKALKSLQVEPLSSNAHRRDHLSESSPIARSMEQEKTPIGSLQAQTDQWIKEIGGGYFSELTNMAMLSEEVGEVARIIARRYGDQNEKESDREKDLGEELSDVLFVVLCLANQTGIDLQQAWLKRMESKTDRDRHRFDR